MNKVFLMGNLGKDPELKYTSGGAAVCRFPIATTEKWKDKNSGSMQEKTEWHNVVVWNAQAENCNKYLQKGRPVMIEGKIQTRSWDDKDGNKRYTTEITATTVQFLGGGRSEGGYQQNQNASQASSQQATAATQSFASPPAFDEDDDIPF